MKALECYDAFVVDLDGVCWLDGHLFEGIPEALAELEAGGKSLLFVTNNSFRTPERFAAMLTAGPFEADPASIVTSSSAAARLLRKIFLEGGSAAPEAVLAGGEGLFRVVESAGIEAVAPEEWRGPAPPQAIVVGVDRNFTYERLSRLARFVREGAAFVATNTDATYPTPEGLVPGAGSIVAAVEVASGKTATVAGKPQAPMVELVSEVMREKNALVIGDRPDTDLAFAHRLGMDAALVLSGVSGLDDALAAPNPPRFVARSLPELLKNPVELAVGPGGGLEVASGGGELAEEISKATASASAS